MTRALLLFSYLCLLFSSSFAGHPGLDPFTANVKDFGAKGDGITEDQAAFKAALVWLGSRGGGQLYVPAGTYILAKEIRRAGAALEIQNASNLEIYGDGPDVTILKLKPGQDYQHMGDTHVLRVANSQHVRLHDLTFDGSKTTFVAKNEQMHGLYLLNTGDVLVERVRFFQLRGDGTYVIGENGYTEDVTIRDCSFYDNGRSGIANQGGIRRISYLHNTFELTSDQDIDLEPTGKRTGPADILIQGNWIMHSTGALAVTLAGTNTSPAQRVSFLDNVITGGGLWLGKVQDVVVRGDTISTNSAKRALDITQRAQHVQIKDNRLASAGKEVLHMANLGISDVAVVGNRIEQSTASNNGIYVEEVGNEIEISNNSIIGVPGRGGTNGIHIRNQETDGHVRSQYSITGNLVQNFSRGIAFTTHDIGTGFANVTIDNNTIQLNPDSKSGIYFETNRGPSDGHDFITGLIVNGNTILP